MRNMLWLRRVAGSMPKCRQCRCVAAVARLPSIVAAVCGSRRPGCTLGSTGIAPTEDSAFAGPRQGVTEPVPVLRDRPAVLPEPHGAAGPPAAAGQLCPKYIYNRLTSSFDLSATLACAGLLPRSSMCLPEAMPERRPLTSKVILTAPAHAVEHLAFCQSPDIGGLASVQKHSDGSPSLRRTWCRWRGTSSRRRRTSSTLRSRCSTAACRPWCAACRMSHVIRVRFTAAAFVAVLGKCRVVFFDWLAGDPLLGNCSTANLAYCCT